MGFDASVARIPVKTPPCPGTSCCSGCTEPVPLPLQVNRHDSSKRDPDTRNTDLRNTTFSLTGKPVLPHLALRPKPGPGARSKSLLPSGQVEDWSNSADVEANRCSLKARDVSDV